MNDQIYILPVKFRGSSQQVYSPVVAHVSYIGRWHMGKDEGNYSTSRNENSMPTWHSQPKQSPVCGAGEVDIHDARMCNVCV